MNYSDYNVEDFVIDDDFIAYVNGAKSESFDQLKNDPSYSEKIKKAAKIVSELENSKLLVSTFNLEQIYENVNQKIDQSSKPRARIVEMKWVGIAAAAVAIFVIAFPFFMASESRHITSIAQQDSFTLPDSSRVELNSSSSIHYNPKAWKKHRYLVLEGEAFFDVEDGSKFVVKSAQGIVTVIGTKFNIRDRIGFYEVECLEGSVEVSVASGNTFALKAGDRLSQVKGEQAILELDSVEEIDWLEDYIEVRNQPLGDVLKEVARHFEVTFANTDSIAKKKYSGFFSTVSLDSAMQQIFWPLDKEYEIKNQKVFVK